MKSVSRRSVLGTSVACLLGEGACSAGALPRPVSLKEPEAEEVTPSSSTENDGAVPAAPANEDPSSAQNAAPHSAAGSDATDSDAASKEPEAAPAEALVCERVVTIVGRNHGHELLLKEEDILAQAQKVYSLRGSSSHDHQLVVSPEEFALVGLGQILRKKTEFGAGHRHRILIRCEPEVLPPDMVSACRAVIAGEDGHEVVIPESHVRGGVDRLYDVQGVSGHTHALAIQTTDFQLLLAGQKLDLTTQSAAGHFHHVYIEYLGLQSSVR